MKPGNIYFRIGAQTRSRPVIFHESDPYHVFAIAKTRKYGPSKGEPPQGVTIFRQTVGTLFLRAGQKVSEATLRRGLEQAERSRPGETHYSITPVLQALIE